MLIYLCKVIKLLKKKNTKRYSLGDRHQGGPLYKSDE